MCLPSPGIAVPPGDFVASAAAWIVNFPHQLLQICARLLKG
jgi:hypothetical protein